MIYLLIGVCLIFIILIYKWIDSNNLKGKKVKVKLYGYKDLGEGRIVEMDADSDMYKIRFLDGEEYWIHKRDIEFLL